jgi:hypothetical protein
MAKRVSKNRPWGLNRSPHKIESLGSTLIPLRVDRMHRSCWSDAPRPASGRAMSAMCHCGSTAFVDFQRSTSSAPGLKSRPDAAPPRPLVPSLVRPKHWPDTLRRWPYMPPRWVRSTLERHQRGILTTEHVRSRPIGCGLKFGPLHPCVPTPAPPASAYVSTDQTHPLCIRS